MLRYHIHIWWSEEDGTYLASIPDLPGCMADGKTPQEAAANIQEVAALWIARATELGRAIPAPRQETKAA